VAVVPSLTQQEDCQRQVLLTKVKDYWIEGVLKTSLHARAMIELGLHARPDLVQRPFQDMAEFPDIAAQALPDGTSATTTFDQMGQGRTLLILGEPGSGKTVTLLKLAEDLIARAENDASQPIPLVLNLSSWARRPQPIEKWLVKELSEKYHVSKVLGEKWVETESLLLLLDGLDEVKTEHRNGCVQVLNQFMKNHGTTEITISCRIKDYLESKDRLLLRTAICIQALTIKQIDHWLNQAGIQLNALKALLSNDEKLLDLAKSPLMLSIMSLAYQDCKLEDLIHHRSSEDYRQHLFDTYIERMFQRQRTYQQYSQQQTYKWLVWLAQRMVANEQTILLVEYLQPTWFSIEDYLNRKPFFHKVYKFHLMLMSSFGFSYDFKLLGDIKPVETLRWSWNATQKGFLSGWRLGLRFPGGLVGPFYGFIFGLMIAIFGGFRGPEIQQRVRPNQGIFLSARNGCVMGATVGFLGLAFVLTSRFLASLPIIPPIEVFLGLLVWTGIVGLIGGGGACVRHFALRLGLYVTGYSPWNYAHFLDHATDRLFLQKVGGGYIFVHRMLLEHFAAMPLGQEKR
jgi:hypothetical protein